MNGTAILDFIKEMIWPTTIIVLLIGFAKPIKNILFSLNHSINTRGIKVSPTGIEVPSEQSSDEKIGADIHNPRYIQKIIKLNIPELVDDIMLEHENADNPDEVKNKYSKNFITNIKKALRKIYNDHKETITKNQLYCNLLIDSYIQLFFERTYQKTLGTQLELLDRLYRSHNFSLRIENAKNIYEEAYSDNAANSYDRWLEFLVKTDFIAINGEECSITDQGKDFVEYIYERQYPLHKAG